MFAEKVMAGETVVGIMVRLTTSSAIVPLARAAGLDFIMLDLEHAPYTMETIANVAVAARASGLGILVRVPELSRGYVSRALDQGVNGVMVPMIETPEQAAQLAAWAKYPPVGGRGLSSLGGHTDYASGGDVVAMMERANRETLCIAQVETALGAENAEAIAATPGIDVLLVGPNDLSVSLGHPGKLDTPDEQAAIAAIADGAHAHGKIFAMHAGSAMLRQWVGRDMKLVMNGIDTKVLGGAMAALASETRAMC